MATFDSLPRYPAERVPDPAVNRSPGPAVGLAHDVQPPPAPPDHVQHSTAYGLDYESGELVAYPPRHPVSGQFQGPAAS